MKVRFKGICCSRYCQRLLYPLLYCPRLSMFNSQPSTICQHTTAQRTAKLVPTDIVDYHITDQARFYTHYSQLEYL